MKKTKVLLFLLTLVLAASSFSLFANDEKHCLSPSFGAIADLQFADTELYSYSGGPTIGLTYEYNLIGNFWIGGKLDLTFPYIVWADHEYFGWNRLIPLIDLYVILDYEFTSLFAANINVGVSPFTNGIPFLGAGVTINKQHSINVNYFSRSSFDANGVCLQADYIPRLSYGYKMFF